jgi:hypothetical protein
VQLQEIVTSNLQPSEKILMVAAALAGRSTLPSGKELEGLAAQVGVSASTAYRARRRRLGAQP